MFVFENMETGCVGFEHAALSGLVPMNPDLSCEDCLSGKIHGCGRRFSNAEMLRESSGGDIGFNGE